MWPFTEVEEEMSNGPEMPCPTYATMFHWDFERLKLVN
jgi:hypothetical protein